MRRCSIWGATQPKGFGSYGLSLFPHLVPQFMCLSVLQNIPALDSVCVLVSESEESSDLG